MLNAYAIIKEAALDEFTAQLPRALLKCRFSRRTIEMTAPTFCDYSRHYAPPNTATRFKRQVRCTRRGASFLYLLLTPVI